MLRVRRHRQPAAHELRQHRCELSCRVVPGLCACDPVCCQQTLPRQPGHSPARRPDAPALSPTTPQCNKLFIACDGCKTAYRGCCCEACQDAPRLLRPAKTAGLYGNWAHYADGEEGAAAAAAASAAMAQGRGEGRISRRRKRQQALKERDQAKRTAKVGGAG